MSETTKRDDDTIRDAHARLRGSLEDAKLGAALRAALADLPDDEAALIVNPRDAWRTKHRGHGLGIVPDTDATRALAALLRSPTPEGPPK